MMTPTQNGPFDATASRARCRKFRRRILDISQTVPALHIAPAFSCLEMVDAIYFGLMRREAPDPDTFILSKGHGAMAQYCVLEELGILAPEEVAGAGKEGGRIGMHPDLGVPGIEASTGSLGHGLPIALGMALADRTIGSARQVFVVISDGELEEGSVWEALMLAPTFKLTNLVVLVDLNDFQSLGQISMIHPNFYPMLPKIEAFGWEATEIDGHDPQAIVDAVRNRKGNRPFLALAKTVKGKGVSYMESVPLWHYRSPNAQEYALAVREVEEGQ
ncbi:MAG: transketolase [Vicinamibacterales bacterium]